MSASSYGYEFLAFKICLHDKVREVYSCWDRSILTQIIHAALGHTNLICCFALYCNDFARLARGLIESLFSFLSVRSRHFNCNVPSSLVKSFNGTISWPLYLLLDLKLHWFCLSFSKFVQFSYISHQGCTPVKSCRAPLLL